MNLRTVIVDDEPLARDLLRVLLNNYDDIEVVAECKNGRETIDFFRATSADLLFLDVQMPRKGGFDVVEEIGLHRLPPTVFVTAYQEHAVRAFDVNAIDYLTKPVESQRLQRALERVREKIAAKAALFTHAQFAAVLQGLQNASLLRTGRRKSFYPLRRSIGSKPQNTTLVCM
jgi:two-component system, LytTR family, response regulator